MKVFLRAFVYTVISMTVSQSILSVIDFGDFPERTHLIIAFALTLLFLLIKPVLKLLSLPNQGMGFLFMSLVLSYVLLYVMTLVLGNFNLRAVDTPNLNILGFMLPSKSLNSFWAGVFYALLLSCTYSFMEWLNSKK